MTEPSDTQLLFQMQHGDMRAFDLVYGRYAGRLAGYLRRMAKCSHLADDLMQETWLRLARHLGELRAETDLGAWLFAVARNAFLSHVRSVISGQLRPLPALGNFPTHTDPCEQAATTETLVQVEQALMRLPIDDREILLLVAVEKLETAQVALVLGLSQGAVRKRLQRARDRLQRAMLLRPTLSDGQRGES